MKEVKDWTFEDLRDETVRRFHDALLRGGGQEMRSEFYNVYNLIEQWQKVRDERAAKYIAKRRKG